MKWSLEETSIFSKKKTHIANCTLVILLLPCSAYALSGSTSKKAPVKKPQAANKKGLPGKAASITPAPAPAQKKPNFVVEAPTRALTNYEWLRYVTKESAPVEGTLLYSTGVLMDRDDKVPGAYKKTAHSYLVMRQISQTAGASGTPLSVPLAVEVYLHPINPLFSPDGRHIVFGLGEAIDRNSWVRLVIYDRKTRQAERPSDEPLSYFYMTWSPNSRYVTYIKGGDIFGGEVLFGGNYSPLQLYVYDRVGKSRQLIVQNSAVKRVSWTPQNTLLFSKFPMPPQPKPMVARRPATAASTPVSTSTPSVTSAPTPAPRPDLYEVSVAAAMARGKATKGTKPTSAQLVLRDAYRPVVSPDGRWIACFSSTSTDVQQKGFVATSPFNADVPSEMWLCLYDRKTRKRLNIQQEGARFSELIWTPDSRKLVILTPNIISSMEATCQISVANVVTGAVKPLATIEAHDYEPSPRSPVDLQFAPVRVSADGRTLLVKVAEDTEEDTFAKRSIQMISLKSVSLETGVVMQLAQVETYYGIDWQESTPQNKQYMVP